MAFCIGLMWSREHEARRSASSTGSRFAGMSEAFGALGVHTEQVAYADEIVDEVRARLLRLDGVLVWVDPIVDGRDRRVLDALLRDIASRGVWVSTHPDVILKMGVKEVLYRTKHLGWGTDTHLYRDATRLYSEFPSRLGSKGPRVLKQNRGNDGQGVWKVEALYEATVRVLHAHRGSLPEELPLSDFLHRCEAYFADGGCIIDQPFQPRLPDGMIRCYMAGDRVAGFGHQFIKALIPPPPEGPDSPQVQPSPRIMHLSDAAQFQLLRAKMEAEWTPQMMQVLDLDPASLPALWDADFLYGPRTASGEDSYVLCEINVSSVIPFPPQAPAAVARLTLSRLQAHGRAS